MASASPARDYDDQDEDFDNQDNHDEDPFHMLFTGDFDNP